MREFMVTGAFLLDLGNRIGTMIIELIGCE